MPEEQRVMGCQQNHEIFYRAWGLCICYDKMCVVRWSCFRIKFTKCNNTLSGTYKIHENMHDFVVFTVKIDLEVSNSLKSKLFILYSRYNL